VKFCGYAAILIGTFLDGETILVLAGLAAHQGYEVQVFTVIALLGVIIWTMHFYHRRKHKS
jgi:membrane protein DedA with SNARE-associated domain